MEGREMRRSVTLSDHMAAVDGGGGRRSVTLASVIESEKREAFAARSGGAGSSRTLMDVIREENAISRGEFSLNDDGGGGGVNWRAFKNRLRLRRSSEAWVDASSGDDHDLVIGLPTSPVFPRSITERFTETQFPRSISVRDEAPSSSSPPAAVEDVSGGAGEEEQPVRVSLMALLEQSDPEGEGSEDDEAAAEADEEEGEVERVDMFYVCCVCMVRHKGAAFIPCGHTFCRLCSRELWVNRGNCPLCNGYILEILDIF